MCVIVTSQADTMPSLTQLARMSDANPDGAGIAWHDGQRLHRYRNEDNMKTLAFIMDHWQSLETSPFLLHFRLATHGRLEWLTADHETIPGGTGAIEVSNTNWDTDGLIGYDLWEEAYRQGLEAGYETAIEEMADSGYATTLDYTPPRR